MTADDPGASDVAVRSDHHFDFYFAGDAHTAREFRISGRNLVLTLRLPSSVVLVCANPAAPVRKVAAIAAKNVFLHRLCLMKRILPFVAGQYPGGEKARGVPWI